MSTTTTTSTTAGAYIPPLFTQYGKASKDLFRKKYEYDHTIKTLNATAQKGSVVETGAQVTDSGAVRGFFKGKYAGFAADSVFKGTEAETELSTDPAVESKGVWRFNNWAQGLSVSVTGSSRSSDKAFKRPVLATDVEYATDYVASSLSVKSDLDTHKVDSSLSVGYNNCSVGGSVSLDVSRGTELVDRNFGAEYVAPDFVASLYTERNASVLTAAYFQRVSRDHHLGAQFRYELAGRQERSLAIGTEYKLDKDTTVKAKVELPSGDVAAQIQHRLANPRLLLGLAAQCNAKSNKFSADKLGVSITFGDY